MLPKTMMAIVQEVYGGPEVLNFEEVPAPVPGPHDLVVAVKAVSVNPVDIKRRSGGPTGMPVPDDRLIVGWDAAGIVAGVGSEVSRFQPGDEVYFAGDVNRPGSYAQFVAVDERIVGRKPASLSFAEAAAIPLTALTAWEGMFEQMGIPEDGEMDETILIVGGGGGVGSIACQLARKVAGLRVIATASRPESIEFCHQMGAEMVINHRIDYLPQLKERGIEDVPLIFSTAPLTNFDQMTACLAPFGVICCILGGPPAQALNVAPLFTKRGTLTFELMFTRPSTGIDLAQQGAILDEVADLLDAGTLVTTVTQIHSWREVRAVHEALESGQGLGKFVLMVEE